ncbi:MAG: amidase, partial [Solirubrobacteraceae bacterium]|nr:amidase [Solirubrobacteraceae bacterium]
GALNCALVTPLDPDVARQVIEPVTSSPYDVVGKTIEQMQADMTSGKTTSQEITRAYLDRIAAYDTGQYGFHSFIYVADDAMEQAKKADEARAKGTKNPMLGIPVGVKDLYSTKDMPTTGGSRVFDGFRPTKDSFVVKRLRENGAIILGKLNLSEYANSGHFSESAFGQVWNAFEPSKSAIGSSGGSASATALSLVSFALGSQTGDSLWGPSSAASLYSLRGTDGMTSNARVMPLTWLQDYAGPMTRSIGDLADSLNVITGTDPEDFRTKEADAHRPADWRSTFKDDALAGKKIGWLPSAFADPFGTTATSDALKATFSTFTAAGATVVQMTGAQPTPPAGTAAQLGDRSYEGWSRWLQEHPESSYTDATQIIMSQKRLPYSRYAQSTYQGLGPMTQTQIDFWLNYRKEYKQKIADWMDAQGVDAVVYPGLLSDVNNNDGQIPSFGRLDPPSSASGAPTVIFPVGTNPNGEPMNLQILGKAWEDDKLLGYAYAFDKIKKGHVLPTTAPALKYEADVQPKPIVIEVPAPGTTQPANPDPQTENPAPTPTPAPVVATPTPAPVAAGSTPAPVVTTAPVVTPTPVPLAPVVTKIAITVKYATTATVKSGSVKFTLSNSSSQALTGVVTLKTKVVVGGKSKTITLGTASISVGAKGKKTLSVKLTSAAKAALKGRSKITATVSYKLANASGTSLTKSKTLVVKLK